MERAIAELKKALEPVYEGMEMDPHPEYTGAAWEREVDKVVKQVAERYGLHGDTLWINYCCAEDEVC